MDLGHLEKYETLTFKPTGTLFDIDLRDATERGRCPYCGNKLVEMRNKDMLYCRGKKHRNRFVISKDKCKFVKRKLLAKIP